MKKAFVLIGFVAAAAFLLFGGEIAKADSVLNNQQGGVITASVVDPGTGGR